VSDAEAKNAAAAVDSHAIPIGYMAGAGSSSGLASWAGGTVLCRSTPRLTTCTEPSQSRRLSGSGGISASASTRRWSTSPGLTRRSPWTRSPSSSRTRPPRSLATSRSAPGLLTWPRCRWGTPWGLPEHMESLLAACEERFSVVELDGSALVLRHTKPGPCSHPRAPLRLPGGVPDASSNPPLGPRRQVSRD